MALALFFGALEAVLLGLALAVPCGEIDFGLWGYNSALTATAVLTFFAPTRTAVVMAAFGVVLTVILDGAFKQMMAPFGAPAGTLPFCAAALLLVLAQGKVAGFSAVPLPDVSTPEDHLISLRTDPEGWFRAVDVDGNGKLSRKEVVEALKAQLRVDNKALDAAIADPHGGFWRQWDKDGSGTIEKSELLAPQGLAHYVRSTFLKRQDTMLIPDIKRDKNAWYAYWDEDGSGTLEKEEVVRALLKTLNLQSTPAKVLEMRGTIDAIWPVFDPDGSNSIDKAEFLAAEGLANTIIATVS